jgi:hypothetical protein
MLWMQGRRMKRCRGCGNVFAFKHHAEWYCSTCRAEQATKRLEPRKPPVANTVLKERRWTGVRAAEIDAKAALAELRAWMANERAKF